MSEDWSIPFTSGAVALEPRDAGYSPGSPRPKRADLERILADKRLTVRQIAREFSTTTRAVQQVVCNVIYTKSPWLSRNMWRGEYVYFLTNAEQP